MAGAGALRRSRRERELHLRKEITLEAAEEVFADKGYHDAAVEDIAARAEISIGTLDNLFTNKEGLFLTAIEQRVDHLLQQITQRVATEQTAAERFPESTRGRVFQHEEGNKEVFLSCSPAFGWKRICAFCFAIVGPSWWQHSW